ncbi:hypothetical protein [Streptomyces chartreusis]|uniref:hypothetical protein n=1 Tax=Streptomyces chartreusis TaxID=1969 RepID=UPI0036911B97
MTRPTKGKATDPKSGPRTTSREKKTHLLLPDINLGGLDDDEDEDDFRPARAFVPPAKVATGPALSTPAAVDEADAVTEPARTEGVGFSDVAEGMHSHDAPALPIHDASPQTPAPGRDGIGEAPAHTPAIRQAEERREISADQDQVESRTHSSELTSWAASSAAPAVRDSATLSGLPARRPGRRRTAEPFNADQPRQRGQQAMFVLSEQAPKYASLLAVYSASQLDALKFENRNINLYGLVADQAGTQITADKALIKTLTLQRPKLTVAHYVDAALEPVLRPLDPTGIDLDAMEEERDYVWQLAQKGLAYRRYILSDPDSANLANYRPVCSLRADVNARLTRMMDIMESIQGIQAKPFEIVSACLAEYVGSLPEERQFLTTFFQKHLVTTIQ